MHNKTILQRFILLIPVVKKLHFDSINGFKESFPWEYDALSENQKAKLPLKNKLIEKSKNIYIFLKNTDINNISEENLIHQLNQICQS